MKFPALGIVVIILLHISQADALDVSVYDPDAKVGVQSKLYLMQGSQKAALSTTDKDGKSTIKYDCIIGDQIVAEPLSGDYYPRTELMPCLNVSAVELRASRLNAVVLLETEASDMIAAGAYKEAAQKYSELVWRKPDSDASFKVAESVARALKLDPDKTVFWNANDKTVTYTDIFSDKIKDIQSGAGLPRTGTLNNQTLTYISNY